MKSEKGVMKMPFSIVYRKHRVKEGCDRLSAEIRQKRRRFEL